MTEISQPAQELVPEEVKLCIDKLVKEIKIKNYALDISSGSAKGENYLGVLARTIVRGEDENGEKKVLSLIVKSAPRNETMRSLMTIQEVYKREIYMYDTVFTNFAKFQEEKKVSKPFNSFAKYYFSLINESNECLVLEDMKAKGYELHSRHETFNYEQVLIAVKEYGKFHALSFALKEQKPELFQKFAGKLEDMFFVGDAFTKGPIKELIDGHCARALASLDPVNDRIAYEKLRKFIDEIVGKLPVLVSSKAAGAYAVIGHGDCWKNNMLFKYGNSEKSQSPTNICFLDWQLSRFASPVLDLSYLIFTSTSKELRAEHYENLIREYYNSLSAHLKELGGDPEKSFPFEVLQEHLHKFSIFGLYTAISVLIIIVNDNKDIPDVNNFDFENDAMQAFQPQGEAADKYNTRVRDIILDFVKYNYL